ncbi:MAG TPA: NAD(P)/FAD-dependent oxidoreductase, partial [Thermomicrobiales bacterium]|nr:NAD(P)/FAD-dependent oxidoreductase [Thermomicrobiales bacterium]
MTSLARGFDAEAIVVGAGPAGSAVAALLAEAGHRVLLLDKAAFPRHKACSEYVNPAGVRCLERLGVLDAAWRLGGSRIEAMEVVAPGGAAFAIDYARSAPGQVALGLSRWRLDHLLLRHAAAAGAEVIERAHVRGLVRNGSAACGVEATIGGARQTLRAPLVIGADGRHSAVTRALGLDRQPPWPRRTGLVAHYCGIAGLARGGAMHVGPGGCYAGFAPLEDGLANVAFVSPATSVAARPGALEDYFEAGMAAIPGVADRLRGAERIGAIRGVGSMAHRARRSAGDGWLLVGDAAWFLDPFTGDGITEALLGAVLAAPIAAAALRAGATTAAALAPYPAARRQA